MKRYLWGFPGVGKSSLDIPGLVVEDADSKLFEFKGVAPGDLHGSAGVKRFERDLDYPRNYLEHVQSVDADVVLLNCHVGLLEQLDKDEVLVVYPSAELVPEYLERYQARGDNESFVSYMADEAEGIIQFIEGSDFEKYRIDQEYTYLGDLFERADFKMKIMTKSELTKQLQRAKDLDILGFDESGCSLVCDVKFLDDASIYGIPAEMLADDIFNGKYALDIDELIRVCNEREETVKRENILFERRGGLSRDELADKIMQGIVNGALGIRYEEIAPYSLGYKVTFGGEGPIGSTWKPQVWWGCRNNLFDVPNVIAEKIEGNQTYDIREILRAIDDMEQKKVTSFTPEKELDWERRNNLHNTGHLASVVDVHGGKGLDGIIQHHYRGDASTRTPILQNNLVETLVCLKGFCLDCIDRLDIGSSGRQKVVEYLKKHGTDVSTIGKMRAWIRENPEKCGREENRFGTQLGEEKLPFEEQIRMAAAQRRDRSFAGQKKNGPER